MIMGSRKRTSRSSARAADARRALAGPYGKGAEQQLNWQVTEVASADVSISSSAVACRGRFIGASFGEDLQEMLSEAHVTAILVVVEHMIFSELAGLPPRHRVEFDQGHLAAEEKHYGLFHAFWNELNGIQQPLPGINSTFLIMLTVVPTLQCCSGKRRKQTLSKPRLLHNLSNNCIDKGRG